MRDDLGTMLGALLFVALLLALAFAFFRWGENTMRDAAVKAGKAEYGVDKNGDVFWRWKP